MVMKTNDQEIYIVKTGGLKGLNCTHTTIAAALTDAATSGNPVKIYIRNGTYTETLVITTAGLTLEGESRDGVIVTSSSGTVLDIHDCNSITVNNLTLKQTGSNGNAVGYFNTTAGAAATTENWTFNNCKFRAENNYAGAGSIDMLYLYCSSGKILQNISFLNCSFELYPSTTTSYITACTLFGGNTTGHNINWLWDGCTFTCNNKCEIGSDWGSIQRGLYIIVGNQNGTTENVRIVNNSFLNTDSPLAQQHDLISISNYSGGTTKDILISNNYIKNLTSGTDVGILINKSTGTVDGITVVGNHIITDTSNHIIQSNSPTNVFISSNNLI